MNLKLKSADNTTIGAWFIFSDPFYRQLPYPPPPRPDTDPTSPQRGYIPSALQHNPTILFFHGNTGTRALTLRTVIYTALTSRLNVNIMVIDYRGFGDSEGYPSVEGVSMDARAGWDFLMGEGATPEDVLIMGHSLGTAITGLLAAELGREGVKHRGTVLMSVRRLVIIEFFETEFFFFFFFFFIGFLFCEIAYRPVLFVWFFTTHKTSFCDTICT